MARERYSRLIDDLSPQTYAVVIVGPASLPACAHLGNASVPCENH
jgi:hypothetical protein